MEGDDQSLSLDIWNNVQTNGLCERENIQQNEMDFMLPGAFIENIFLNNNSNLCLLMQGIVEETVSILHFALAGLNKVIHFKQIRGSWNYVIKTLI